MHNGTTYRYASTTPDSQVGGVSHQSGTFTYSFPIVVPPGRLGMEPDLALEYSSDAPIYGGIAAGWSLNVPAIRLDTTNGTLVDERRWVSDLSGGERLIPTDDAHTGVVTQVYRARYDSSGLKYERQAQGQPFEWVARGLDGTVFRFGRRGVNAPTEVLAVLDEIEDVHGNQIQYTWKWYDAPIAQSLTAKAYALVAIEYTRNSAAGLAPHAWVELGYDDPRSCTGGPIPVGSQLDARTGTPIFDGYFRLRSITTNVAGRDASGSRVRRYELVYDDDEARCDRDVAPRRQLREIRTRGWALDGTATDAKPVTFNYYPNAGRGYVKEIWDVGGQLRQQTNIFVDNDLVDIDGDGLPDRLASSGTGDCDFTWQRNTGYGFEAEHRVVKRPELAYGQIPDGWALDDFFTTTNGLTQRCALNVQYTLVASSHLEDYDERCTSDSKNYRAGSVINWRFLDVDHDGQVDLVAGADVNGLAVDPQKPGFSHGGLLGRDLDHQANATFAADLEDAIASAREVYDGSVDFECRALSSVKIGTHYPWMVFRNLGDGQFSSSPTIWGMPVPVPALTSASRSAVGHDQTLDAYASVSIDDGNVFTTADPFSFVDIDGDGFLDIVSTFKSRGERDGSEPPSRVWKVMRGMPQGGFTGRLPSTPYTVDAPVASHANGITIQSYAPGYQHYYYTQSSPNGAYDLNGDRVPDYAFVESSTYDLDSYQDWEVTPRSWLGTGKSILSGADNDGSAAMTVAAQAKVIDGGPGAFASRSAPAILLPNPVATTEWSKNQLVDIDGDGRNDLITHERADGPTTLRLNAGGTFLSPFVLTGYLQSAALHLDSRPSSPYPYSYLLTSLLDVDGDGVLDTVTQNDPAGAPGRFTIGKRHREPAGLLHFIDNGVGGRTYVNYASVRDDWVVESWHLPVRKWVVAQVEQHGGEPAQAQVTTYRYAEPTWTEDEDGRRGFRGFRRVDMDTPTGARVSLRFDHSLFHRGLLVETVTSDATLTGTPPRTIERSRWERHFLHGVPIYVQNQRDVRTCTGNQDVEACRAQGALLRIVVSWAAISGAGLLPIETRTAEADSIESVGTRTSSTTFSTFVSGDIVRVKPKTTTTMVRTETGDEMTGRAELIYDPLLRSIVEERHQIDDSRVAITKFTHDDTGLIVTTERPESVAADAERVTTVEYDAARVHAKKVSNELGHVTRMDHDPGTGMVVATQGPQFKCPAPPFPCFEWNQRWRRSELRYDGLSRLLSRHESFDNGVDDYVLREVERHSYHEWAGTGPAENRLVSERRIDSAEPANWTRVELVTDGLERPVRETVSTFEGTIADAVTIYHRDERGLVTSVESPDPSRMDAGRTTTYFAYDGLGRTTQSWHSSGLGGVMHTIRDGLWTEHRLAPGDDGPAPSTRFLTDARGRVRRVEEKTSTGAPAVTEYEYDGNDNLARIVDADGLVTTFDHDLVGNRLWVERSGRRTSLTYDLEGRVKTVTRPHPAGQAALYRTHTTYDWVGRLATHTPAPGSLTEQERANVGLGTLVYTYDTQSSAIGALTKVASPGIVEEFQYDAFGRATSSSQRFLVSGAPTTTLTTTATYNAIGGPTRVDHADGTTAFYAYDRRGLPVELWTPSYDVARQSRNPAGLVKKRVFRYSGGNARAMTTWIYDQLGRLKEQRVQARPTFSWMDVAIQTHEYFASNDVRATSETLISSTRTMKVAYDHQSQIKGVEDTRGYSASYEYTPAGRVLQQRLVVPPGADTPARDVFYDYDEVDLERARALVDNDTGEVVVDLSYDEPGNVVEKVDGTGSVTLRYDGDGKLRLAVRGGVTERYVYDASGRRVLALQGSNGTVEKTRRWFGDVEIRTTPTSSDTDVTLRLVTPVARLRNGQLQFLQQGPTGNLLLAQSANGMPIAAFSYGAFGEILKQQQQTAAFPRRFQDNERDDLTGWYDFGHRLYDPQTLLWNAADPLFTVVPDAAGLEPRRMALYAFNLNNPLRYVDPDGRNPVTAFFDFLGRAFTALASEAADMMSSAASGLADIAMVPVHFVEEFSNGTVAHMYASAGPCSYDCAETPSNDEMMVAFAMAAGQIVAPEFGLLRTAARGARPAQGASPAATGTAAGRSSAAVATTEPAAATTGASAATTEFSALPTWRPGEPARGVLMTGRAEIQLASGSNGGPPALPFPGRNNTNFFHVEAHAAQVMRVEGITDAALTINKVPCGVGPGCANNLKHMLPEGARLRVLGPDGYDQVFVGSPDPPGYPR